MHFYLTKSVNFILPFTNDPVPPFSGYITDSNGNIKTLTTSPFNGNNIVTKEQMKKIEAKNKDKNKKGTISPNDWWSGDYYYEYIPNSYTQTSYMRDNYKFYVGGTSFYNSTPNNASYSINNKIALLHLGM